MQQIELIHWALIRESQQNPRKSFDKDSLKELAESISKQGLLQPITVRPMSDFKVLSPKELKGKSGYEIVCGARRYRAAKMTDMVEVPCIVRVMTDEEAFDAMITENLQRKDVAPMDEARAFAELHKRGTSFEELAARFGKSVPFIRLRIKLNDLVPELVELLEKKELQISHAQELCKLSVEHQTDLFTNKYSDSSQSYYKWNEKPLKDIKNYIDSDFRRLDNAIFDKSDCENCEFRCGANALFAEYSENKCTHTTCYDDKVNYHYISLIEDKTSQGYLLVSDESMHSDMKEFCKELENTYQIKKNNYQNSDWFSIIEMPELPEREEDDSDEDWAETLEAYEDDLKEYETDLAEQNERLQNGFQRALRIGWNDMSEIIIKFKDENEASSEEVALNKQLAELQSKDKRNAEIKVEKVTEEARTLMSQSNYETWNYPTTENEDTALYALLLRNTAHNFKREVEINFNATVSYFENCKTLSYTTKTQIVRAFIQRQITGGDVTYSKEVQSILSVISKEAHNDDTVKIELKHEDTYLKRKEKIDEQIKALTEK